MSGHSKWATTKRHKAAVDAKRGTIFSSLSKDLTLAAKDGGGAPTTNARLRMLLQKATAWYCRIILPKRNIQCLCSLQAKIPFM